MNTKTNKPPIFLIVVLSTILTCGLLLPVWLLVGAIWLTVQIFTPNKQTLIQQPIKPKPKYKTIFPDNSFADDWDYIIIEDT